MALNKLFIPAFDVPPQEVLTKDSVTVSVDAVVYYRVSAPLTSFERDFLIAWRWKDAERTC